MINQEHITLYPLPESVFADPVLALYFKPLLTATVMINNKSYAIHLLSTDGLICKEEQGCQYAENYFFGFAYNRGLYQFKGNLQVFENADKVPVLYHFLKEDFLANKDRYLKSKTPVKEYLQSLHTDLKAISAFTDLDDAEYYAKAFYSYEFTRFYYQKYGAFRHVSVVTEGWAKNTNPFLLDEEEALNILEEWLEGFREDTPYDYTITEEMLVAGTERRRFAHSGGFTLVLLDPEKEIVYMVECGS